MPAATTFAGPDFDTRDPVSMNDAFEAAVLDVDGRSLVHTISTGRDTFFNLSEGQPAELGAGATLGDHAVDVNLAGIAAGTDVTVIFRLVNNDRDTGTSARIARVQFLPSPEAEPPSATPAVPAAAVRDTVDFAALSRTAE